MNRRTALKRSSATVATLLVAGCLSADPASPGENGDDPDSPEDAVYAIDLETEIATPEWVDLEVDLVDPYVTPASPARIDAKLANGSDDPVEVGSGAPSPFGVVWLSPADDGDAVTLWTDAYEGNAHVGTDGKHVTEVEDVGVVEELAAGESVSRTFELHAETPYLESGTYEGEIGCRVESGDRSGEATADLTLEVAWLADAEENPDAEYAVADVAPTLSDDVLADLHPEETYVATLERERDAAETFALEDEAVATFVDETDFASQALLYVRAVAPQTCYRASLRSLSWYGDALVGEVAVERTADEDEACGEAITYPAVLARVETGDRDVEDEVIRIVRE